MPELKPCPFCGGEAHAERSLVVGICAVVCNCASHVFYDAEADMDKTIDAWNTRAVEVCEIVGFADAEPLPIIPERTCRRFWTGAEMICSECAHQLNNAYANYCPNCGAKVVE